MINTLQRAFWTQFPDWARPTHAVYRYIRQQQGLNQGWLWRWIRWTGSLVVMAGLATISYATAQNGDPILINQPTKWMIFDVLYFPWVVLQAVALASALLMMSGAITSAQQRGTWDAFKITSHGADLIIRARWATVFYQLRWFLALLIGVRVLFIGLMLVDLTDYQGYHLDLYIIGITPEVSLEAAVLLLAAMMAAALLQIVVLVGLNAALGLLIAAAVSNRVARMVVYGIVLLIELGVWEWAMSGGRQVLKADPDALVLPTRAWFDVLGMGVLGDQGLRFLELRTYLQTWVDVEYGVLVGLALLAAVFVQVVITNGMLILAGRLASRPGRE